MRCTVLPSVDLIKPVSKSWVHIPFYHDADCGTLVCGGVQRSAFNVHIRCNVHRSTISLPAFRFACLACPCAWWSRS